MSQTATSGDEGIPLIVIVLLKPGAIHEARARWRPVAMFGRDAVFAWGHTETSKAKALEFAGPRVRKIKEDALAEMRQLEAKP